MDAARGHSTGRGLFAWTAVAVRERNAEPRGYHRTAGLAIRIRDIMEYLSMFPLGSIFGPVGRVSGIRAAVGQS
jgi:hypothetical protein